MFNQLKITAVAAVSATCCIILEAQAAMPENIAISNLPLPPTAPSSAAGACSAAINPGGTGCLDASRGGIDGVRTFTPDGNQVYASVRFAGAPSAPNPASIYSGAQLILVKTDGSTFPNGDGWKCVTCGVPSANKIGINNPNDNTYPEAFNDGKRVKIGNNILDCSPYEISDPLCTPATTHIYPIISPFPASAGFPPPGGIMRELRLHPDNVHLGWNQLFFASDLSGASEFGVFGRLQFNPSPASGPAGYELTNVSFMLSPELGKSGRFISIRKPGELSFGPPLGVIGEFRGFTPDGKSTLGIGTQDSFNYDIFATRLETGKSTRLSRDPAYVDPVNISPDGKWMVIMDGRVTVETGYPGANPAGSDGRMYFASAGPGVPPLIDLAIAEAVGALYTNASRGSFLQPHLLSLQEPALKWDSDIHDGAQLNAGGDTTAGSGSISDPLWLAGADPAWSPDGTAVVYYQRRGCNPAPYPCPASTEPGGRNSRLMIARFADRKPIAPRDPIEPMEDIVPWGIPYHSGDPLPPSRGILPAGEYVLKGQKGSADVIVTDGPSRFRPGEREVVSVAVTYHNYSPDGVNFVDGTESGTRSGGFGAAILTWHSDLSFSGLHAGSRVTSEPGGFVVKSSPILGGNSITGSMTTTLDGWVYKSPN